jgi:hypothetical protein
MSDIPTDDQIKFDYIMSTGDLEDLRFRDKAFDDWLMRHDYELLSRHNILTDWMVAYNASSTTNS